MKLVLFILVFNLSGFCNDVTAQSMGQRRHMEMAKFLVKHDVLIDSLLHPIDGSHIDYLDFIYERKIWPTKQSSRKAIFIFGANSPHSMQYIALQENQLRFLATSNLAEDVKYLVSFFRNNKFSSKEIDVILPSLSRSYIFNKQLKSEITLQME